MQVDIESLDCRTVHFVNRDRVEPEKRERINHRLGYMQFCALRISDENWPPSWDDYFTASGGSVREI